MRRLFPKFVALLAIGALAAGCSGSGATDQGAGDTGYVSGGGTVTTIPPSDRKPAPALAGETLDGERIALSDFAGKVVVLNVWGSWCPPCRKEAPDLVEAANSLASKDVVFLGINTRDATPDPAKAFVRRFDVPYPSVFDPDGQQLLGFRETLPPKAIPSTLVIDTEGRVAARVLGAVSRTTVEQLALEVVGFGGSG
jgi:thiol-disulfide isomerase/thioredoxin